MAHIEWTDDLSVGMDDIDKQHRQFIRLMDKTQTAIDRGASRKEVGAIVSELVDYGRCHFETEEQYFEKFKYPYAKEHIREHEKLLRNIVAYSDRFEDGQEIAQELLTFLENWLVEHLKKHDMKYSRYFKKKGYI